MKQKNYVFEFLRFVCTIGVVVGHIFCFFYMNKGDGYRQIFFHNTCVDFFFILSGLLMAMSLKIDIFSSDTEPLYSKLLKYNIKRFFRLYPLMIVAAVFGIVDNLYFLHKVNFNAWPTFFMLAGINNFEGWGPVWYISALFWGGIIVSGILCLAKRKAVYFYFPVIIFFTISFLRQYGCVNEGVFPVINNFLSAGIVKAVLALSIGVETYYLYLYVEKHINVIKPVMLKIFCIFIEIVYLFAMIYLMLKQNTNDREFITYIITPVFFTVVLLDKTVIFKCVNNKFSAICAKPCSIIYVTHLFVIRFVLLKGYLVDFKPVYVYLILVSVSIVLGVICYYIETFIEKKIKKLVLSEIQ